MTESSFESDSSHDESDSSLLSLTPSTEALELFAEFYENNWINDFENGPQHIVQLDSNCCCNSVPLSAILVCENVRNWSEFSQWLHEHQANFRCEDDSGNQIQFSSAKDCFLYVIDQAKQLDAVLFITLSELRANRILRWVSSYHSHHMDTELFNDTDVDHSEI